MNAKQGFEAFCAQHGDLDSQELKTNKSFVVQFGKPDGTSHNIDPEDIVEFLKFLSANHQDCIDVITSNKDFSKPNYTNYQEKPYRDLYKLAEDKGGLKPINSLGRSQTRGLTQVIAKFICFIAGMNYAGVDESTHFDKASVDSALKKVPTDLTSIAGSTTQHFPQNRKHQFERWLGNKVSPKTNKPYSEKTIKSYSGSSINLADKLLKDFKPAIQPVYELTSVQVVKSANSWLQSNDEWNQKNSDGNSMFQAGLNLYMEFLDELADAKATRLPKPFILLAGISGTGKTRFVREQAQSSGRGANNYCLVPVRPDWHEPSDLLGYVSRLSDTPEYVTTPVLSFILKAWQAAAPDADRDGHGSIDFSTPPYWLCLDEMNLAPVEQYFADYLSVLESRKIDNDGYSCESLLDSVYLQSMVDSGADVQKDLGLAGHGKLWEYFLNHGIGIPPNLIVAGTVNMDETTHGFSRKVIDRALTFDFGEFFPNDYDRFFTQDIRPVTFTYSTLLDASTEALAGSCDPDGSKSIGFLKAVNDLLRLTPFELAYRALNELLLHVACFKPADDTELQAVWDDFLMSKLLPRLDGDEDKLRISGEDGAGNLLDSLLNLLEGELREIWSSGRIDFYRERIDGSGVDEIGCRSKAKLQWMKARLEVNTFTSFWP